MFQEIYIHTKQGKAWKCEALKNIYVNFVWLIGLGNQNYPHLGKRVSDGTSEPWNQTNRGYPNKKKWHVISRSEIKYVYIYIYISFFVRYKHDLTCNQFIQISCNLFWNIYIHIIYQYFVRYKNDLKCNQIYAIFMSFVLKNESVYIYIYHHILKYKNDLKCN